MASLGVEALTAALRDLDARCGALMRQEGIVDAQISHFVDVCYIGQSYHLEVPLDTIDAGAIYDVFLSAHARVYDHSTNVPAEIVNLRTVHQAFVGAVATHATTASGISPPREACSAAAAPKFLPYMLSFIVLGLRWLSNIRVRSAGETCGRAYAEWWLVYHLLITCVPFTTMVFGRFADFAPAIWRYAGNTILISGVSFRLLAPTPAVERTNHLRDRRISLGLLIASSVLSIVWSFISPRQALWALALNLAGPTISRRMGGTT